MIRGLDEDRTIETRQVMDYKEERGLSRYQDGGLR